MYTCYARGALAVFKYGKEWTIGVPATGKLLSSRLRFPTRREAAQRRDALLRALPSVDWSKPIGLSQEIMDAWELFGYNEYDLEHAKKFAAQREAEAGR